MWTCVVCSEAVEDHFAACWNCQSTRSGRRSATELTDDGLADAELKAIVNQRHKPMKCLRCGEPLVHSGTKKFHEGPNLGILGDLGELLITQEHLDMYVCKSCGHIEFFMFGNLSEDSDKSS